MEFTKEQEEFYRDCLTRLEAQHGTTKHYLVNLKMYVKAVFKTQELLDEIMEEAAIIKHTNKAGHTNDASSPKARMFALFNEQAMKLGKALGLELVQGKVGRPTKKKKDFTALMKAL